MKIVFKHDRKLPVSLYGGVERILFWHMKNLVKMGHQVFLIGHPESDVQNDGITLIPRKSKNWVKDLPRHFDIVHLFYNDLSLNPEIPLIITYEFNAQLGEELHRNCVFVSKKQAENHGAQTFVYNGIELADYPFKDSKKGDWEDFLFLAKAKWKVKNVKSCIRACRKMGKRLAIVGGHYWPFARYIKGYGMLGGEQKLEIIRRSDALLFPVLWHEPFGIAVIEAMGQGLPALVTPYGSLPELVGEEFGHVCKSFEELCHVLKERPKIFDRYKIREYVENNFSMEIFSKKYIPLYQKVMAGEFICSQRPRYSLLQPPESLLPF